MLSLIQQINPYTKRINPTQSTKWQSCADIFYLLDTIKISYESSLGKITIEDIALEDCAACFASLKNMTQQTDCTNCPFVMTVCGVTWDIQAGEGKTMQRRIRAIPKAAGLRFFDDNRVDSDAYFYQANLTLDDAPSDHFTDRQASEAIAIAELTPEQFIHTLQQSNQHFIETHGAPLHLHKANFEAPMSEHETKILAQF